MTDHTPVSSPSLQRFGPKPPSRHVAKSMFLLTYKASSKSITHKMMMDSGLCPTECHSLEHDDGFKYSFVKLLRRAREPQIREFMQLAIKEHGVEQGDEEEMLSKGIQPIISGGKKTNALTDHPALQIIRAKLVDPQSLPAITMESWKDKTVIKKSLSKRFREEESDEASNERSLLEKAMSELKAANKMIAGLRTENKELTSGLHKLQQQHANLKAKASSRRHREDTP